MIRRLDDRDQKIRPQRWRAGRRNQRPRKVQDGVEHDSSRHEWYELGSLSEPKTVDVLVGA